MANPSRKTFYIDDDKTKPVTAGGVIIYRETEDHSIDLLLVESRGLYEDLGGCVDPGDESYVDTVVREAYEESNKLIKRKPLRLKLENAPYCYSSRCKYIVYITEATSKQKKMKEEDFGTMEIHDNIPRTIKWINIETFLDKNVIKYKLNWRLKNKDIFDKLRQIEKSKIMSVNLLSESSRNNNEDSSSE